MKNNKSNFRQLLHACWNGFPLSAIDKEIIESLFDDIEGVHDREVKRAIINLQSENQELHKQIKTLRESGRYYTKINYDESEKERRNRILEELDEEEQEILKNDEKDLNEYDERRMESKGYAIPPIGFICPMSGKICNNDRCVGSVCYLLNE